uniref:DNA polymerase n=1 Tax=Myochromella boudieri TaxID=117066 RepID=A0A386TYD2_9AGAR|nr:DNA polymerase [Myochromella boudieri]AYE93151.1 DNA polymerase [Myochromella boudieri]
MIPFKLDPGVVYTDTDSVFTSNKLPDHFLSNALGYMKDELGGNKIEVAYFLDIKKYGYWHKDIESGDIIERSVFAGVKRNSLKFSEVRSIANGHHIIKNIPINFYKSMQNLDIKISSSQLTIKKKTNDKKLIDNNYSPGTIFNLDHPLNYNKPFII